MPKPVPLHGVAEARYRISRFWGEQEQTQNQCDMSSCHA